MTAWSDIVTPWLAKPAVIISLEIFWHHGRDIVTAWYIRYCDSRVGDIVAPIPEIISMTDKNLRVGPSPSGHTHYLKVVLKKYLVTFEQGVGHEGVGPTLLFSHIL